MSLTPNRDTVWTRLSRDVIRITGTDRIAFLHNLCTQDIKRLGCLRMTEVMFLNVRGKVMAHGVLCAEPEQHLLILPPGTAAALLPHLDRYIIREDVQLTDWTAERAWAAVQGTEGVQRLKAWFPELDQPDVDVWTAAHDLGTLTLRRTLLPPPESYLLEASSAATEWWNYFAQLASSFPQAVSWQHSRVAAGWPEYGQDVDDRNLPQELDRDASAIHFQKGCYLGQETVARIDALGHVNQLLRVLQFLPGAQPTPGIDLQLGDAPVGRVTSVSLDVPSCPIGLGYVQRSHAKPGTRLTSTCGEVELIR